MLVEGKNAVEAALTGGSTVEKVYILRNVNNPTLVRKIKESGVPYQFSERPALDRMSKTGKHQGFLAFITEFKYHTLDDIIEGGYAKGTQPLIVILDGIEDPHNLGNIIRTAECMGVDGIVIPKNRAATVNETAMRVSAGAAAHIKICKVTNINQEIEYLKEKGFWIYASETGGVDAARTNLNGPIALILGGENTGVHHLTLKLADGVISVPMHGKTNSLNVGSAAAMVLYEVNRQRHVN
jgi:23S rRNA (guanosine2251-2'-O)-methyltransferase